MKDIIRVIIVDDEQLLINTLKAILSKFCNNIVVVDTATDVFEAKNKIEYLKPDLVFLDINMPKLSGFELLQSFSARNFEVVFITAYEQYALSALKEGAVDYILKPVLSDDVVKAVEKVKRNLSLKISIEKSKENQPIESNPIHKIVIQNNNSYLFIDYKDILWLEADHNYTKIYLVTKKIISSAKPLKHYEELFPSDCFFRIHKSYIINTEYIKEYLRDNKGPIVVLSDETKLRVAQPKQAEFRKFMISNGK